jgi:anti-anti-sigma factor
MDKTVLVIDDEKPTLKMFRLFLSAYGYRVLVAENGSQGLAIFASEKPPIVFTDIKMPGMDGFEVLKHIKDLEPATEVIVVTGHGDMDLAVKALNLNATDFINKPIRRTALESALKRSLERLKQKKDIADPISLHVKEDLGVISLCGSISAASEGILLDVYRRATEAGVRKLILRFDENASINGAGIAVLIQILGECRKQAQTTAICGLSENFCKIFEMTGVTRFAAIFESEQAAIESLTMKG